MLLFCKKRMLKSASFAADPNIYCRIYKIRKDYLCGFFVARTLSQLPTLLIHGKAL